MLRQKSIYLGIIALLILSTIAQAGDVSLAWDASVTPTVTGYKVYVGNAPRTYGTPITIGNQTTYTVTGLNPGTYYFAVSAFDAQANESGYSNEVTTAIYAALTLTGPSVTNGIGGVAFSAAMTASGGKTPYTYSITTGTLPNGLTLNASTGMITGTPTKAGAFPFTVRVTDSAAPTAASVSQNCTITIVVAPPGGMRITSQSASLNWYGVVLLATTSQPASAIMKYSKVGQANYITVIATPQPIKTQHRVVLYNPMDPGYYNYQWSATAVDGTVAVAQGTFQAK